MNSNTKPITVRTFQQMKEHSEKITMLTSYDYSTAKVLDEAGIDVKKPMEIIEALVEAFVEDKSQNGFGVEVNLDYYIMKNIRERFIGLLGEGKVGELDNYLIELKFETAEINLLVSFLDE